MPKMTAKFFAFTIDQRKYTKTLDEEIKRQMRMAARAFLNVAMRAIPVRTGFARGSLKNLAEAAGLSGGGGGTATPAALFLKVSRGLRFPSTREDMKRAGAQMPLEYYRDGTRKILKTPQGGRDFATPASQIITVSNYLYSFNFETFITYFRINDAFQNPKNKGTPWNAFKFGRATFVNYMNTTAISKLPRVDAFVIETAITVSGGQVTTTSNLVKRGT